MIAFFDASALIYLVEGSEPFSGKVRSELAAAAARHPELAAAVSRLTWLECRVQTMKANDPARAADARCSASGELPAARFAAPVPDG